jgi:DNA-binding CsgD family transcriptional regulator
LARRERLPDIAKRLGLSVNTLHTFLRRAQKKLKAKTRLQAAVIAARLRLF